MFKTIIDQSNDNITIYNYLLKIRLGQSKINHFLYNDNIKVNNKIINDKDYILKKKDKLLIDTSYYDDIKVKPIYYNLDILYEDEYILAVRKPRGLIIYSLDDKDLSLDNYVAGYYEINNIDSCVRHIHRLDKETTGVILYAKDVITHGALSSLFEDRKIIKKYLTVVKGKISKDGVIDLPIGKDRHHKNKMVISKNSGLESITHYHILGSNNNYTFLECIIETGRTHQIRVQFASRKHPLVGDGKYGNNYASSYNDYI